MKGNPTTRAQSGGVSKSAPNKPSMSGSKGTGLAQAWSNQSAKPAKSTDMSAAKKRVR
jgi:hypothetical protein